MALAVPYRLTDLVVLLVLVIFIDAYFALMLIDGAFLL